MEKQCFSGSKVNQTTLQIFSILASDKQNTCINAECAMEVITRGMINQSFNAV